MHGSLLHTVLVTAGFTIFLGFITGCFTLWKVLDFSWPFGFGRTWTGTLGFLTLLIAADDWLESDWSDLCVWYALGLLWLFTITMATLVWRSERRERIGPAEVGGERRTAMPTRNLKQLETIVAVLLVVVLAAVVSTIQHGTSAKSVVRQIDYPDPDGVRHRVPVAASPVILPNRTLRSLTDVPPLPEGEEIPPPIILYKPPRGIDNEGACRRQNAVYVESESLTSGWHYDGADFTGLPADSAGTSDPSWDEKTASMPWNTYPDDSPAWKNFYILHPVRISETGERVPVDFQGPTVPSPWDTYPDDSPAYRNFFILHPVIVDEHGVRRPASFTSSADSVRGRRR